MGKKNFALGKNIFNINKIEPIDLLNELSEKIKYGCAVGVDGRSYDYFRNNKDAIINEMNDSIHNESYTLSPYKEMLLIKGRNEYPRCLSIPTIQDKLFLYFILNQIDRLDSSLKLPLPQQVIGKLIKSLGEVSSRKDVYIAKYDIRHFFNSINHKILFKEIDELIINKVGILDISDKFLIESCRKAIQNPTLPIRKKNYKGVPQGIPIASELSQIYFSKIELALRRKDVEVFRYVDDIILICHMEKKEEIKNLFLKEIESNKLSINSKKIKEGDISSLDLDFLGYNFSLYKKNESLKVSVKEVNIKKIKQRIVAMIRVLKNKKNPEYLIFRLNCFIAGSIFKNGDKKSKYGWIFFYSQINDIELLYQLDRFIKGKLMEYLPNLNRDNLRTLTIDSLSENERSMFRDSPLDLSTFVRKSRGVGHLHLNSFVTSYRAIKSKKNIERYSNCFYKYSNDDKYFILSEILKIKNINRKTPLDKKIYKYVYSQIEETEKDIFDSIS